MGYCAKKYLDPLIKVQKKIVRIITFSPYLCHTDPIFKDLNLLPISKLVTQVSFTGVYIWNKIQDHINVYSTYSTFKDALKSFLLVHDLNYRIL